MTEIILGRGRADFMQWDRQANQKPDIVREQFHARVTPVGLVACYYAINEKTRAVSDQGEGAG
jgi:hypothetical protein